MQISGGGGEGNDDIVVLLYDDFALPANPRSDVRQSGPTVLLQS